MHGIMFHHFHNDGLINIKSQGSISEYDLERMIKKYQSGGVEKYCVLEIGMKNF